MNNKLTFPERIAIVVSAITCLAIGLLPFVAVIAISGCSTTQSGGGQALTPNRVKAVAYLGTSLALQQHPEYRPGFTIAVEELKVLESQDKIDFTTVLAIVHKLPVKQLQGDKSVIIITTTIILFDDLGGSLDLSKLENAKPYVTALREGIQLALQ